MAATTGDMEVVITVGAAVTDALLELARADEIALVAMSTHGRGGIQRLLLGSVTDKVVRAAAHPPSEPRGQVEPLKTRYTEFSWEEPMAEEQGGYERERDILIRSIEEAFEALRVIPELDVNGPVLVWLTDHLYLAHSRVEQPA